MPRKILIVDDNRVNRMVLARMLHAEYDVIEAEDGVEAMDILRRVDEEISAVLLDLQMPVMDGYQVLKEISADDRLSQIPVIVATSSTTEAAETRALSLGANDFITKPYNPSIIRHRLRNTIRLRETAAMMHAIQRDRLTGLYSREAFFARAEEMIAAQEPGFYVMACFDLVNFKVVNDRYGSAKGDEVLKMTARIFQSGFEPLGGICGRIMADNFAVLYPVQFMNSELVADIRQRAALLDGSIDPVTYSIGRYIVDDLTLSGSAMYDRAAIAQATVRARFDTPIAQYSESMRESILREQEIVDGMDAALKSGQFENWYQPQYNHSSGALIGAEVLARWRHPEKGLIPPSEFIPVFERNGFVYGMDKYIWERACIQLRAWLDAGLEALPVSVNISRYDVFRDDFFDTLAGLVKKYDLPISLLRLEITESAFAQSDEQIIAVVKRLIEYGFTVEIDDFGSGYSSLNTLKDVPADILKLDMRFLDGSGNTSRGGNILESIIRMAKWLGMPVIAEGVETKAQADYLLSIGCLYIQGYLYARPMPAAEYERLLASSDRESKMASLETVDSLDNNAFWDPNSIETLIFNSYVGGACIFEYANGKVELLRVNAKYATELGGRDMTVEQVLAIDVMEYMSAEDRQKTLDNIARAAGTDAESTIELLLTGMPGAPERTYIRATVRVIARAASRMLLYCAIINITPRRESERKEREATAKLRAIAENINGGVTAVTIGKDNEIRYLYANDRFYEQLGYTRAQFDAEVQSVFDLAHPDDRDRIMRETARASADKKPFSITYRTFRRDGSMAHMHCNISIAKLDGVDEPVQIAVSSDITAQVEAQEKEREAKERLQAIMENANSGIVAATLIDGEARIIFSNNYYFDMLGYTREEYAKTFSDGFGPVSPKDKAWVIDAVTALAPDEKRSLIEYRVTRRDGREIWVQQSIAHTRFAGVEGAVQLSVLHDVTDRKLAEEQSAQVSSQMEIIMENIVGGVSAATLVDGVPKYVFVNDSYYAMFGYTREQFERELPRGIVDLIHPDDVDRVLAAAENAQVRNESFRLEYRARRRDGRWIWVRSLSSVCRLYGSDAPVQLAVSGDITEEVNAKIRLTEAADQLRYLNETAREVFSQPTGDEGVRVMLRRALEYFDGDRAYIIETDDEKREASNTYVAHAGGGSNQERIGALPYEVVSRWLKTFSEGRSIEITDADQLPDSRAAERELLKKRDITSLVAVSLSRGERVIGLIGVSNPRRHTAHVSQLLAIGDYVAVMLARRDMNARVERDKRASGALTNEALPVVLKAMMAFSGDLAFVKDRDLTYLCCSKPFARVAGLQDEDEIAGKTDFDLFDDDYARKYRDDDLRLMAGGQALVDYLERVPSDDGAPHYVNTSKYLLYDAAGSVIGLYGIGRDVTAEREAHAQLKLLANSIPGGIAMYDVSVEKIRLMYCSDGYYAVMGYTREEYAAATGEDALSLVHQEDAPKVRAAITELLAGADSFDCTYRARCLHGGFRWLNLRGTALERSETEVIVNAVKFDITDRVRHDEALRVTEEQYRLALEYSGGIIARYDVATRSVLMTPGVAALFGMPEKVSDVPDAPVRAGLISPETQDAYTAFYEGILRGEKSGAAQFLSKTASGWRWLKARYVTVFSDEGKPLSAMIVMEDVTRERAETAAYKENEQVLRLVAEHSNRVVYRYDMKTKTASADSNRADGEAFSTVCGDMPESVIARGDIMPESIADYRRVFREIDSGVSGGSAKVHVRKLDGTPRWIDLKYSLIPVENGRPRSAVISFLDITESHEKELAYERYLQSINDNAAAEGVLLYLEADLTTDLSEKTGSSALPAGFPAVNCGRGEVIEFIAGYCCTEAERERCREFFSREHLITAFSDGARAVSEEWGVRLPDGRDGFVRSEVQMVQDPYTGHIKSYTILRDITREKHEALEVRKKAEQDGMTGLYNKATAETMIAERLASGEERPCALLAVDLDNLKIINDSRGHACGDAAIMQIGDMLRAQFRKGDIIGRVGGDEFVVFLDNCGTEKWLHSSMTVLMKRLSSVRVGAEDGEALRASFGITMGVTGKENYAEMFRRADLALYHVKRNGKNDFAFYEPGMDQNAYQYKAHNETEIWRQSLFGREELDHLLAAVAAMYPLVLSVNLTRNAYYIMKYEKYATRVCVDTGVYDDLIAESASTFHPDDRQSFIDAFSRESLLADAARGVKTVTHRGRQLGDDKAYRRIRTDVIFVRSRDNDDVLQITLAREVGTADKSDQITRGM